MGQKVVKHATNILGCQGYNLLQNNGEAAGQTVFHFHLHLIPRYEGAENILNWKPCEISGEEIKEITDAIRLDQ